MRTIISTLFCCLLAASSGNADIVSLASPTGNISGSGGTVLTTTHNISSALAGTADASVQIQYTLTPFATIATLNGIGSNSNPSTEFGVNTGADGSASQRRSIDGDDGERLSITGLSLINFNPGTSGLSLGNFSVAFDTLITTDSAATSDGAFISFTGFSDTSNDVDNSSSSTPLESVDLTALNGYSTAATELYIQPNNAASNNRFSIDSDGIVVELTVTAVPEPGSLALLALGLVGFATRRRR